IFDGLKYIYRDWTLPTESADKGVDGVVKHYSDLSSKYGYEVVVPEFTLNNAGYLMLFRQRYQDAIAMFQKNIELHPGSANVYDSMGEAYERSGQMALAKENYEKAYNTAKKANHPLLNAFKTNFERASKAAAN
ncbi:MAG: tetratricopeptide repeat protein, partial [Bacteroidota bacterium]|nr:tetratricopeptide repeat protein [Bacteroidota bacterium]